LTSQKEFQLFNPEFKKEFRVLNVSSFMLSRSLLPVIVLNTLQAHGLSCFAVTTQSRAVHAGTSYARGGKPCVHEKAVEAYKFL
jgi:hypothetical protein